MVCYLCSRTMSRSNTRRVGKTWWQIACQGWILPQNEVYLSKESVPRYFLYVYSCCKYYMWHSVLTFCYFVCVIPYIVVPARRVGAEARLQERDKLIYDFSCFNELWWTMKSRSLMLWTVKSPPASSLSHFWFRDVASPIPSWHRLWRGSVTFAKVDTWLTYLLCCTIVIIVSVSNLIVDKISGCGFFQWPEMCTKVNRSVVSGKV